MKVYVCTDGHVRTRVCVFVRVCVCVCVSCLHMKYSPINLF